MSFVIRNTIPSAPVEVEQESTDDKIESFLNGGSQIPKVPKPAKSTKNIGMFIRPTPSASIDQR